MALWSGAQCSACAQCHDMARGRVLSAQPVHKMKRTRIEVCAVQVCLLPSAGTHQRPRSLSEALVGDVLAMASCRAHNNIATYTGPQWTMYHNVSLCVRTTASSSVCRGGGAWHDAPSSCSSAAEIGSAESLAASTRTASASRACGMSSATPSARTRPRPIRDHIANAGHYDSLACLYKPLSLARRGAASC